MSEAPEARGTTAPHVVHVPVDFVEFEARLLALERRMREQEARDQLILDVSAALRRLTEALGPLLEVVGPLVESSEVLPEARPAPPSPRPPSPQPPAPAATSSQHAPGPAIEPERLAAAQARLREAATEVTQPRIVPPAADLDPALVAPSRRSWLLRALRRMAARDPESAGRLLVALLPASRLAQVGPVSSLPGSPATVARVVVKGRLRRRLGWEVAQLTCELPTVSALAKLVRLRASPVTLQAAGVRLDPPLALALVANAIDPVWTLGHRFTLAHIDSGAAYLEVNNGLRPAVLNAAQAGRVQTTVRCSADALLPFLAGEANVAATVEGERRPLELLQRWFQHATSA